MDIGWKWKAVQTETVRSPAVAGSFYPDSPQVLSAQVQKFIHPIIACRSVSL